MEKLNCIIVDDEPIARRGMRRLVDLRDELYAVGSASNTKEAEKLIASADKKIDLIFLDIDMEGESGLEFARRLSTGQRVIFTTAFADYALDSYEVEAVDYLLKPIRQERFNRAVDRILNIVQRETILPDKESDLISEKHIVVKAARKFIRIKVSDIVFVEGLGDYLVIHLHSRRLTSRMTFKAFEEMMEGTHILRVNKSYMVNSDRIDSFNSSEIRIADMTIPVGATFKDKVKKFLLGGKGLGG